MRSISLPGWAKATANHLFALSFGRLARRPNRLRILTFHDVGDDCQDELSISREQLAVYLALLADEGFTTVRSRDLVARWPAILNEKRLVVLTFDDGYAAQRDNVAELLHQRGMTATFFIVSSFLGDARSQRVYGGRQRTFLSAEDLRQMDLAGLEIGSHSHTHAMCGRLSRADMILEARCSKEILEEAVGRNVTSFAYPFGRQGAFSSATRAVLDESGYSAAFTQEGVGITIAADLLRLPRISVDRSDTARTFRRKLLGQYELLYEVMNHGARM